MLIVQHDPVMALGTSHWWITKAHALATAYSHAALGEDVVSSVTKFEFSRLIFDWLDKFLRNKLIKHGSFVPL
jgi:hypothetical protein